MLRMIAIASILALAALACGLRPTATTVAPPPSPPATGAPGSEEPALSVPPGWSVYRSQEYGFTFAYPGSAVRVPGQGDLLDTLTLPADPSTNVLEEAIAIRLAPGSGPCTSPLAEGFAPEEVPSQAVERNGVSFLRQEHSGVAAGTAIGWVAYSTSRGDRCVSLDYTLSTFDPGNLDPTRFPTPPASVSREDREAVFEQLVATFVWLR